MSCTEFKIRCNLRGKKSQFKDRPNLHSLYIVVHNEINDCMVVCKQTRSH